MLALAGEVHLQANQHIISLARFDAREKLSAFLLGICSGTAISSTVRPFKLGLTQEEIADHLGPTIVHVSRTLRRLREEKLLIVDRQVVILLDVDALRDVSSGLTSKPIEVSVGPAAVAAEAFLPH